MAASQSSLQWRRVRDRTEVRYHPLNSQMRRQGPASRLCLEQHLGVRIRWLAGLLEVIFGLHVGFAGAG